MQPPTSASSTDDGGRQPEQRAKVISAIDLCESLIAQEMVRLSDIKQVDLLPIDQADRLLDVCRSMQITLADMAYVAAQIHAKRTGQSVSGRLQPQIEALRRHAQAIVDTPADSSDITREPLAEGLPF